MRRLLLALCLTLLPWAADAASSVATSWPTNAYALTDGASITVPCPGQTDVNGVGVSGFYTLNVLGNNHTLSLPSCQIPSAFLFRITQGAGGPYTGLKFSAGSNTVYSTGGAIYSQTQIAGAIDDVGGQIVSSTAWDFFAPQYALASPPPAIVQSLQSLGGSGGSTTQTVTLTGFTAGDTAGFVVSWCGTAACATGAETITSVSVTGGTCTQITNAFTGVATPQPAYMYRCTTSSTGSIVFTANWSANAFFQSLVAFELKNDNGFDPTAGHAATGASGNPTVTSGVLSQATNELVVAFGDPAQTITAVNSPFTLISFSNGAALGWYLVPTCSSCTEATTFTVNISGQWSALTAGFEHAP